MRQQAVVMIHIPLIFVDLETALLSRTESAITEITSARLLQLLTGRVQVVGVGYCMIARTQKERGPCLSPLSLPIVPPHSSLVEGEIPQTCHLQPMLRSNRARTIQKGLALHSLLLLQREAPLQRLRLQWARVALHPPPLDLLLARPMPPPKDLRRQELHLRQARLPPPRHHPLPHQPPLPQAALQRDHRAVAVAPLLLHPLLVQLPSTRTTTPPRLPNLILAYHLPIHPPPHLVLLQPQAMPPSFRQDEVQVHRPPNSTPLLNSHSSNRREEVAVLRLPMHLRPCLDDIVLQRAMINGPRASAMVP
mmetsp:Transcript_14181/g.23472  ORF Transcript_14181/g.23472 Transcript_14181/m.23472 type:complete len:307 (-) Transcript_14181:2515-3435(-)